MERLARCQLRVYAKRVCQFAVRTSILEGPSLFYFADVLRHCWMRRVQIQFGVLSPAPGRSMAFVLSKVVSADETGDGWGDAEV